MAEQAPPTVGDLLVERVSELRVLEGETKIVKENYRKWLTEQKAHKMFQEEMDTLKNKVNAINQSIDDCLVNPNQYEIPTIIKAINQ